MTTAEIVLFDDNTPESKATTVVNILSNETQELVDLLINTSIKVGGYGLAAPQIGEDQQLFVYRKNINTKIYKIVINPKVIVSTGKLKSKSEGCLSLPGIRKDIVRYKNFIIYSFNRDGKKQRIKGMTRIETLVLQHEFDHLVGKTILSY